MFLNFKADDGDRSPWGSFWFNPVPFRGGLVTPDGAMSFSAVYACVRILAEGVATLPFTLSKVGENGSRKAVTDHWLYRLFAVRPNEYQNPFEFREMLQGHLALRGNAYCQIFANRAGQVTDLIPMNPASVTVDQLSTGDWRYRVVKVDGSQMLLARNEVFHLRGLSSDGISGIGVVDAARTAISLGLAAESYGNRFFQNDARPGGWIETPTFFANRDDKARFRDAWQAAQTGMNSQKTAVLEGGMKFHETALDNDSAQFLETRKFQISDIARWFRIPPHMIGDLEKATFSNIEQQSLEFVIHTLTPWLTRWEQGIRNTFLDPDDPDNAALQIEFPTVALLRGDAAARGAYYAGGILNGWMTRNEARAMESLNPLPGLEAPLIPLNMVEEGDDTDNTPAPNTPTGGQPADEAPKPPGNGAPKPPGPSKQPKKSRAVALLYAAADRVARKECASVERLYERSLSGGGSFPELVADFYTEHAGFIASVLALPAEKAHALAQLGRSQVYDALQQEISSGATAERDRILGWLKSWEPGRAAELAQQGA